MDIDLHPEAIKSINEKAEQLLGLITEIQLPDSGEVKESELFPSATITDKDIIGEVELGFVNGIGEEVGKYFIFGKKYYGFVGTGYQKFLKIVQSVHKNKMISNTVSFNFIKKCLFSWAKDKYKEGGTKKFTDFLLQKIEEVIDDYEILIPVPFTTTSKPFKLGKIEFVTITENMINEWFSKSQKSYDTCEDHEKIREFKLRLQKEFQGYMAGIFRCKAEKDRAQEIAYYHMSNSLSILRLFSPANLFPELLNGAYEYGQKMIRSKEYFCIRINEYSVDFSSSILDKGLRWNVDSMAIDLLNVGQLSNYNKLLCIENLNEYQEKLFEAINIYSKNTLRYEIFDKLLYILVALETMLLRNNSEPIQQT